MIVANSDYGNSLRSAEAIHLYVLRSHIWCCRLCSGSLPLSGFGPCHLVLKMVHLLSVLRNDGSRAYAYLHTEWWWAIGRLTPFFPLAGSFFFSFFGPTAAVLQRSRRREMARSSFPTSSICTTGSIRIGQTSLAALLRAKLASVEEHNLLIRSVSSFSFVCCCPKYFSPLWASFVCRKDERKTDFFVFCIHLLIFLFLALSMSVLRFISVNCLTFESIVVTINISVYSLAFLLKSAPSMICTTVSERDGQRYKYGIIS